MISSVFYLGYLPVAPGTMGSFAALFLYYFIHGDHKAVCVAIVSSLVIGFFTSGKAEEAFGEKDPSEVVIDEFAGMLITVYSLPYTMGYMVGGFLLFRFFDIVKPRPIHELEKLHGGLGIMIDDVIAGLYANFILQTIYIINLLCH